MSTPASDVYGPIDFVLIEFPGDRLTGEVAPELVELVEQGTIRIYDLVVIGKGEDGSVEAFELHDPAGVGGFSYFAGAASGLIGDDDISRAADAMSPGTVAALLVYENSWAVPFIAAARRAGGDVIASARIPAQDIMDDLDELEAIDSTTA
ncbi:DUF6325 family protein [Xylanimonas sp. McL0601]|uniref:DUF6325 family protein n=1 Tax=Xylanimonas sp. McL0601 TaxID=3414739 RepID=UPI003CF1398D